MTSSHVYIKIIAGNVDPDNCWANMAWSECGGGKQTPEGLWAYKAVEDMAKSENPSSNYMFCVHSPQSTYDARKCRMGVARAEFMRILSFLILNDMGLKFIFRCYYNLHVYHLIVFLCSEDDLNGN
jgi:hypothetical protein